MFSTVVAGEELQHGIALLFGIPRVCITVVPGIKHSMRYRKSGIQSLSSSISRRVLVSSCLISGFAPLASTPRSSDTIWALVFDALDAFAVVVRIVHSLQFSNRTSMFRGN